jgi:hypothetical protein
MSTISRREIIRQLALISAAGSFRGMSFAKGKEDLYSRPKPITRDFYVIFSGAWLFSFDSPTQISAMTTKCRQHKYQYGVSSKNNKLARLPVGKNYTIQVQGNSLPKQPGDLIQAMIQNNQGIFFNNQVQLSSSLPTGLRKISLSIPSAIEPAALFTATRGGPLVSADPSNTLQPSVNYIPGAVVFVYSGWTSASFALNATSILTFDASNGGAHLMFRVCPAATCDHPIPCDTNYPAAVAQQEQHAKQVFTDLLGLLDFQTGSQPTLSFPVCTGDDTGIVVNPGSDKTLNYFETGMFQDPCGGGGKLGTLHTCAAAGLVVGA